MPDTNAPSTGSREMTPPDRTPSRSRLLIVLRDLGMGGAQRQAALIANGVHARGTHAVEVWAFEPGSATKRLLDPGIPTRIIHPGSGRNPLRRAHSIVRFIRALRRARPDILLPFTDFPNRVLGAVWPLTGATACIWNQRDEGREVTGRPLERRSIRKSSWFVANSAVGREHLMNTFGIPTTRISIIRNGVVVPAGGMDRTASRQALGIQGDLSVAAMVANIHRFKDHQTLLRAWRSLIDGAPMRPLLVLAGRPGDTQARVTELRSELGLETSVRFLGEVDDVGALLSAIDLAVFSSFREGCPNAVLEAMAAGLPVVATDITGTREALGETYPFLVPPSDPEALATAIRKLLTDPETRRELGSRNRARVAREFSPQTAIEAYETLIANLICPDGTRGG